MDKQQQQPTTTPVVSSKHHSRNHHRHHHHHRSQKDIDQSCFWIFFVIVALVFVLWIVLYYTVPVSSTVKSPSGGTEEIDAFVFKKFVRNLKPSRKRRTCKTSENYDPELEMCVPVIHTPNAFDEDILNASTSPCASLFNYSCGRWIGEHSNEDRSFTYGYWRNEKIISKIVKTTISLNKFHKACMNMHTREAEKESYIEYHHAYENLLGKFRTYNDIPIIFGKLQRMGFTSPILFSIQKHPISAKNIPWLSWNGFDKKIVSSSNTAGIINVLERTRPINKFTTREIINKVDRISKVLKMLEQHDTDPLEDIVDYEEYLRKGVTQDIVKYSDLPQWNNKNNNLGWNWYFDAIDGMGFKFGPDQEFWVISRPYLKWLVETGVYSLELMDWKAYIEFSLLVNLNSFMPELPSNVYFRDWDIRGPLAFEERGASGFAHHLRPENAMFSTEIQPKSEQECTELTAHMLPGLVAREFLVRAFGNTELKNKIRSEVRQMTTTILQIYSDLIQTNDWLSESAKRIMTEKVQNVLIRVAEPDEWSAEPFEELIAEDRHEHNMNLVRKYRVFRDIQLWHKDRPDYLDRNALAFFATPLSSVNAYYSGPTNTITILAGILQPPFYKFEFNLLTKYAILGSIIGHELGHLLDYNGLHWDKDGTMKLDAIIDSESMKIFNQRAGLVIKEHNKSPDECNMTDYGNATLNENIADLIGIKLSYNAYFGKTQEGRHASLQDRQNFFLIYAQTWCSVFDATAKCKRVKTDVHSLPEYRVDRTFRNIPEFRNVFQCKKGDAMFNEKDVVVY
jgi:predicted metalloendopeptidase